jgi:hypothetical protein
MDKVVEGASDAGGFVAVIDYFAERAAYLAAVQRHLREVGEETLDATLPVSPLGDADGNTDAFSDFEGP